jgi:adenylylsulfate kinase
LNTIPHNKKKFYLVVIIKKYLKKEREAACVIWLTGLSGSGKTTTANMLQIEINNRGLAVEILDGDELRKTISAELGFSKQDRETHARRVAYIAHLLARNGIVTIVALISPYRSFREYARNLIGNKFVEVWVNCSIETCQIRDPKGLYKKADEGKIKNLTGRQDPYEAPLNPEVILDTDKYSAQDCATKIIDFLTKSSLC